MIGSILSNLLLVMGMCFFFGGIVNMRDEEGHGQEQSFQTITAQTTASLMTLSAASMILPGTVSTSFYFVEVGRRLIWNVAIYDHKWYRRRR